MLKQTNVKLKTIAHQNRCRKKVCVFEKNASIIFLITKALFVLILPNTYSVALRAKQSTVATCNQLKFGTSPHHDSSCNKTMLTKCKKNFCCSCYIVVYIKILFRSFYFTNISNETWSKVCFYFPLKFLMDLYFIKALG